ncbi:sensor histidine kinase [Clostridium sp. Marseille-Q7071]
MKYKNKVSIKTTYIIFSSIFTLLCIILLFLSIISSNNIIALHPEVTEQIYSFLLLQIIFIILFFLVAIGFIGVIRLKVVEFSDKICTVIDNAISQNRKCPLNVVDETLLSKIESKLKQLINIIDNERKHFFNEKDNVKSLISDISHQIKTPLANILMYNSTLIERELTKEQRKEFLKNMKTQITKLQWLMESLIKMSRLETGMISLNSSIYSIDETIAQALSGIYLKAQQKNINISVECRNNIRLPHDKKWTSEAIFNILENALKYTSNGGNIDIKVNPWDMFTKIDITDSGIGIDECEINNIFKRFYRGTNVQEIEGAGIGLYITREIISRQNGYIKVKSEKGVGSNFSIFLLN